MPNTRRLHLTTARSPTVLLRVVSECARRQCDVTEFAWNTNESGATIDVTVSGRPEVLRVLPLRLDALVDVLRVRQLDDPGETRAERRARIERTIERVATRFPDGYLATVREG